MVNRKEAKARIEKYKTKKNKTKKEKKKERKSRGWGSVMGGAGGPARYDHAHRFNGFFFDPFP